MPLNLTWVDLAFSCPKGYPGQAKRHSLPLQVEAALKYLVVPLTFAHDCTSSCIHTERRRVAAAALLDPATPVRVYGSRRVPRTSFCCRVLAGPESAARLPVEHVTRGSRQPRGPESVSYRTAVGTVPYTGPDLTPRHRPIVLQWAPYLTRDLI